MKKFKKQLQLNIIKLGIIIFHHCLMKELKCLKDPILLKANTLNNSIKINQFILNQLEI